MQEDIVWTTPSDSAAGNASVESCIIAGPDWDRIISEFDGVCQEQLHRFAHARWPSARIEPFLVARGGEAIGGALVIVQKLPLRLGAVAVTKWGPVLKDTTIVPAYAEVIDAMLAEYAVRRGMMLSILPLPVAAEPTLQYVELLRRGFRPGGQLRHPARYFVDLRLSDAEHRKNFQQKWRNRLNKSERSGLSFERAPPERKSEFDQLYRAMLARKNYVDHSAFETVEALMRHEVESLRPRLFLVSHEGRPVAGAIVFCAGDTAVYLYGATDDTALPLSAGYFMQWNIIRWLRDHAGASWYNLGGTEGEEGLTSFKKGLVGQAGAITAFPPSANYATRASILLAGSAAFVARNAVEKLRRSLRR